VIFGPVAWSAAAVMAAASGVGGYAGVSAARRLSPRALRWGIVVLGVAVAAVLIAT
jgi:uncharacterized protein